MWDTWSSVRGDDRARGGSAAPQRIAGSLRCDAQPPRRTRPRPTCCSTRTTRSTGSRGARRRSREARERDVPLLVSIGYSACHWCHVMERESFEDADDRRAHERALRVRQGRPRGAPRRRRDLHGRRAGDDRPRRLAAERVRDARPGAVLRRHVLPAGGAPRPAELARRCWRRIAEAWRERRDEIERAGRADRRAPRRQRAHRARSPDAPEPGLLDTAVAAIARRARTACTAASAARRSSRRRRRSSCCCARGERRPHARCSALRAMARGGIYDQLGGGFARYAVDAAWVVPHFEKMLYDNALLARAYLHGWQVERRAAAARRSAARRSTGRCARCAGPRAASAPRSTPTPRASRASSTCGRSPSCASALGDDALPTRDRALRRRPTRGNFEGASILVRDGADADPPELPEIRRRLLAARERRVRPGLDDKRLTSWNALMIAALAEAGAVLERAGLPRGGARLRGLPAARAARRTTAGCCAPGRTAARTSPATWRTTRTCSRRC